MSEGLEMEVEFTQKFTVHVPSSITTKTGAKFWFRDDPYVVLRDALDIRQGNTEILDVYDVE